MNFIKFYFFIFKYHLFKFFRVKKTLMSYYKVKLKPFWEDETFKYCYAGYYGNFYSSYLHDIKTHYDFLDIGSNQGLYSLIASKNKNINKIICFEPLPYVFEILKKNIELNNIDEFDIYPYAISNENKISKIYINKSHSGKSSLFNRKDIDSNVEINVKTKNFSFFDSISNVNSKYIVKIDVEGHEEIVIKELFKSKIGKNIQTIFFEVNTKWTSYRKIEKLLSEKGFTKFIKTGDSSTNFDVLAIRE